MKIIQFGSDNYLVLDGDEKPIFEFTLHCSQKDLKRLTNTEIHTLVARILAEYKKQAEDLKGK